jgi:peptidoglycan/xylan/chitin deacetylase (PgdA/CDA1 family)
MASADLAEQRRQIGQSKQTIEEWIRRPVRFFSYPNGRPRVDYSLDTVALVRDAGFEAAFTTDSAYVTAESNRFELPRFMMLDSISAPALAHRFAFGWARQR